MHHLDEHALVEPCMDGAHKILTEAEIAEWETHSHAERRDKLKDLCENPLHDFSIVYRWYFRLKWTELMRQIMKGEGAKRVVEIGSGESDIIPSALAQVSEGSTYISVNMNDALSDNLLAKTQGLPLRIELIRDDAVRIREHIPSESADMVVFEHSANDILQAILAERHGVDTITADWFAVLPDMIRWMGEAYEAGVLADSLRAPFMALMASCFSVVKPGGCLVVCHYMFQYDLDLGYNPSLWENMLGEIRPWMDALPDGEEVTLPGFDPQWWYILRKKG